MCRFHLIHLHYVIDSDVSDFSDQHTPQPTPPESIFSGADIKNSVTLSSPLVPSTPSPPLLPSVNEPFFSPNPTPSPTSSTSSSETSSKTPPQNQLQYSPGKNQKLPDSYVKRSGRELELLEYQQFYHMLIDSGEVPQMDEEDKERIVFEDIDLVLRECVLKKIYKSWDHQKQYIKQLFKINYI